MSAPARRGGQVAIAATLALLGFVLAIQLRAQQGLAERLSVEREADLGRILSELTARSDQLLDEILDLRVRLERRAGSAEQQRALVDGARRELEALRILLGIVSVRGEGIAMTIEDPEGTVGPEILLDAVQELRDAGAEAIEVDGLRVVAGTAFSGRPGALTVGGTGVRAPYDIVAIGPAATLAEGMRIPGGVVDAVAARERASVRIRERGSVSILSTSSLPRFRYARPRR